jgi:hypothetical protein
MCRGRSSRHDFALLGGVAHRQRAASHVTDGTRRRGAFLSRSVNDLNFSRECLRLAAEFTQLARDSLDPELQTHCLRMAAFWTDRAAGTPGDGSDDPAQ